MKSDRFARAEVGRRAVLALVLLSAAVHAQDQPAEQPRPASRVISNLQQAYTGVLREAESLGYQGRYDRLAPVIAAAFDSEFMARAAIGRQWSKLDEKDQQRWVEAFRNFTVANYAARLNHDSGQKFETLAEEPATSGTVAVKARVIDPGVETVELTYRLRQVGDDWKVIDIYANGTVSEVALRRSEYSTVLKQDGFAALLALVEGKAADLAAGKTVD